ncbi:MAG: ECF transporter S component [Anaerotignum sp.]|nr:ECF transporter S component [Anaerotignum sp.]MBQ7103655.1 ECF transporter S component [Anaerotignum sp.]
MEKKKDSRKLTLSGLFLALALVMPFLTGQIPQIGSMLCPMHFPVLLCGFFCGGGMGFLVGLIAPLLRSVLFGMPPMFPVAVCMAAELAVYGLVCGVLHRLLPKKKGCVYVSLLAAMVLGRLMWGAAMMVCVGAENFGLPAFLAGAVTTALPGILLQLVLIPAVVIAMEKITEK